MLEHNIENDFIHKLTDLKYLYRPDIRDLATLEANFREKFETLNQVTLTDEEFKRFKDNIITPDVFAAAKTLREKNTFIREDGTPLHYTLVNTQDWCKNTFEVVNQLRINTDYSHHRYDVIVLINGVPVVQIELKKLDLTPRRAMKQIVDYKSDPGNGYTRTLLCFMQLFIVSNFNRTYYFANNNNRHFTFDVDEKFLPVYRFANPDNSKIDGLDKFADKFLAKCTLAKMISRYMVLVATEQKLMIMRPYQIYAVQAIQDCIEQRRGNGYIWHTTGSGKTLTSFKTATLLKENPHIEKCLFVVDRKDLDRQTREEFNKFQENCVEENTNTQTLVERLLSTDYADKVIVTTIQKLGLALDENHKKNHQQRLAPLRDKRIIFIFDECHRSQFGENHKAIKTFFHNAQLFGFTGTPIFEKNSSSQRIQGDQGFVQTTQDIFQHQLHTYTITHAIDDRNVLRFNVDYYKPEGNNIPKPGETLNKKAIIEAILIKHDNATAQRKFNAILATASISDAIEYYDLFKTMQAEKQAQNVDYQPLTIACVFSPPAEGNQDIAQIQEDLPQEKADNTVNPEQKKAALKTIIADYNAHYKTNFTFNEFDAYYKDIQTRIKSQQYANHEVPHERKIDITIVVDMLLTGFDSKYLNTLYVDKNLKYHGLIQAFSRTNRILNDTKPAGNIIDFRQQQSAVDEAIKMFSGEKLERAKEIWLEDRAPVVIEKFETAVNELNHFMHAQGLNATPDAVVNLKGDSARSQFITLFKEVQRLATKLNQYTDLTAADTEIILNIIPPKKLQGFKGVYLETAQQLKAKQAQADTRAEDPIQQLDFEFVLFASTVIDYDYIMKSVARYTEQSPEKQRASRADLIDMLRTHSNFMDDRDDIEDYINTLKTGVPLTEAQIRTGFEKFVADKYNRAIAALAQKYQLDLTAFENFIQLTVRRKVFDSEILRDLLMPLNLGWQERAEQESALMLELIPLLHKLVKGQEISGLQVYEQ